MSIKDLYEELNFPSKTKLKQVAKKRKIGYTEDELDNLYKETPVGQLFGKAPASKGHIATAGEFDKFQADIIDYKQFSKKANEGHIAALSVTNVFDRKTYTEKLKSKAPKEVWAAFEKILNKFGSKPRRLDVDGGNEFAASFAERARGQNIELHVRKGNPPDVNFLGVGDAAIGKIKQNVGKAQAASKDSKWVDKLPKSTEAYNKLPNDNTLYGQAPDEVKDDPVLKFRLMQDNGRKMAQNAKQLKQRQDKLEENGYFRAMLPKQTFKRGFKPTFGGTVYKADSISNNQVKSGDKTFEISKVAPVPEGSAKVDLPKPLVAGSQQRDVVKKQIMAPFEARLKAFVGEGKKTVKQIGEHMKASAGFTNALSQARLNKPGGIKEFVKMFEDFKVSEGLGQATVTRKRFRRVGKTPA
jgi:hypothetical protein